MFGAACCCCCCLYCCCFNVSYTTFKACGYLDVAFVAAAASCFCACVAYCCCCSVAAAVVTVARVCRLCVRDIDKIVLTCAVVGLSRHCVVEGHRIIKGGRARVLS